MPSSNTFAALLTEAVYRIRSIEGKTIQIVHDELGYAIGRDSGGTAIEHWRKGYAPAHPEELERLAGVIIHRTDLNRQWLESFLRHGGHDDVMSVCDRLRPQAGRIHSTNGQQPSTERKHEDTPVLAPFSAGYPITHPRLFYGRRTIVRRILDLVRREPLQNAVVIGPRRSGKTSLLHYLRTITITPPEQLRPKQASEPLPRLDRHHWVLVDFQDARVGTRAGLFCFILRQLQLTVPEPCTLNSFLDTMNEGITGPTVILFDEIGSALQRYHELNDEFWESMRALGPQVEGRLGFVLTSHISPVELAHDTGHTSPFFNIFGYTTALGAFNETESRELIASSPRPFPARDKQWMTMQHYINRK